MYNDSNLNFFTEKVTGYDRNGNILSLQRYGQTSASDYGLIDNLTYTLDGNRLNRVDDTAGTAAYNGGFEFVDGASQAGEYAYDANGNLTKDLNKNIIDIQYNFLNLPSRVVFSDGSVISYVYAADGTKLRTVHTIGGATTTTDYCGNVVYENGVAKLLLTEEGYVTLNDNRYHYYLQDHQGNNRVVMSQDGSVEETNHYYPFGGVFASSGNVQPYKYNGKELDTKKGLDLYDYGARQYDAALGRFTTVDAMAESYYLVSPYAYCGNNPVNRVDPTGMDYWTTSDPEIIKRLLRAVSDLPSARGNVLNTIDFSSWNHSTDADFLGDLTFNDQTNMFYSSYGTVENGVATRVGVSFPALRNNGQIAWLEGAGSKWYKKASGGLNNTYPEYSVFFGSTKSGWGILKSVFISMFRSFTTTNTFNANKSGFIHNGANKEKMGRPKGKMSGNHDVQNKQIDNLVVKYKLNKAERKTLHQLVGGEGYSYTEIEQLIKEYFKK